MSRVSNIEALATTAKTTRTCCMCKSEKQLDEFIKCKERPNGRGYRCKKCASEASVVRQKRNIVKHKEWVSANRERIRKMPSVIKWSKKENWKDWYLKTRYGISLERFNGMLSEQGNKCGMPSCDSITPGGAGDWHVDHDHVSGKVRRLLCHKCNVGLGCFLDSEDRLIAAAQYILQHRDSTKGALQFKKLHPDAQLPTRGSEHAAGYDLYSVKTLELLPGERFCFDTGCAVAIPEGCYGRVSPRSGLAVKNGVDVLAGVVDSDYRGAIGVVLINLGVDAFLVIAGDRIAQLLVQQILTPETEWADELPATGRGDGGFGSSGI